MRAMIHPHFSQMTALSGKRPTSARADDTAMPKYSFLQDVNRRFTLAPQSYKFSNAPEITLPSIPKLGVFTSGAIELHVVLDQRHDRCLALAEGNTKDGTDRSLPVT